MGSVRKTNSGNEHYWADPNLSVPSLPEVKRQAKSSPGQKPLFEEVTIDHLKPKSEKKNE